MVLAGFALPECPGSSPRVYPALEGLTAVVHRGLVPPPSRVRPSMCTPVTPAVSYLFLGLQDVQWAMGNSRGARKLARTPHVNQKKKKKRKKRKGMPHKFKSGWTWTAVLAVLLQRLACTVTYCH